MTVWFVSRHQGAGDWFLKQGIEVERIVDHLDTQEIQVNDIVIGSLPVNLVANICSLGGRYFHLSLDLPRDWRGKELTSEDMERFHARLEEYHVTSIPSEKPLP